MQGSLGSVSEISLTLIAVRRAVADRFHSSHDDPANAAIRYSLPTAQLLFVNLPRFDPLGPLRYVKNDRPLVQKKDRNSFVRVLHANKYLHHLAYRLVGITRSPFPPEHLRVRDNRIVYGTLLVYERGAELSIDTGVVSHPDGRECGWWRTAFINFVDLRTGPALKVFVCVLQCKQRNPYPVFSKSGLSSATHCILPTHSTTLICKSCNSKLPG